MFPALGAPAGLHFPAALKEVLPVPSLAVIETFAAFTTVGIPMSPASVRARMPWLVVLIVEFFIE